MDPHHPSSGTDAKPDTVVAKLPHCSGKQGTPGQCEDVSGNRRPAAELWKLTGEARAFRRHLMNSAGRYREAEVTAKRVSQRERVAASAQDQYPWCTCADLCGVAPLSGFLRAQRSRRP